MLLVHAVVAMAFQLTRHCIGHQLQSAHLCFHLVEQSVYYGHGWPEFPCTGWKDYEDLHVRESLLFRKHSTNFLNIILGKHSANLLNITMITCKARDLIVQSLLAFLLRSFHTSDYSKIWIVCFKCTTIASHDVRFLPIWLWTKTCQN